ncbi:MAG: tetratricopeptide repeat protein [Flavobacteriaceae bacterium]
MKSSVFTLMIFLSSMMSFGQELSVAQAEDLFVKANENYRNGAFDSALKSYQTIEDSGWVSSELYFNIGNSFYRQNQLAPSIYYFEKALLLDPNNQAAKSNLVLANRGKIDDINELPQTAFQKLDQQYLKVMSPDQWAWTSVGLSLFFGFSFLLFHFAIRPSKRRLYFVSSILSAVLLLGAVLISFKEYDDQQKDRAAIVFADQVEVTNAPTKNAQVDFNLHEGTKVLVLDEVDRWKKISIADGSTGWIPAASIKEL